MELPKDLRDLYQHWDSHIHRTGPPLKQEDVFAESDTYIAVSHFVHERLNIWEKKHSGKPAPYTHDPVLQKYRFCNILRELDRQTIFFHTKLAPLRDDFSLWLLNMFYCRMVARTQTIEDIGLLSYTQKENKALYTRLSECPRPRYGTPYVFPVSTIMKSNTPTRELFITQHLPKIMPRMAQEIQTWEKMSVAEGVERLLPLFGYNLSFLWTEVLIDVAYQFPAYMDLYTLFPIGPGAQQTFARINPDIPGAELAEKLGALQVPTSITIDKNPIILSAENWEGVGCEYRKYTNLQKGKGRKRIYA